MHLPNLVQNGDEETLREITIEILSPEELKIKQSFVKNKSILLIESSGFVPGDQLVAVNGTNVQNLDRDEVQKLIKTALTTDAGNQSISLKVSFFLKILEFLSSSLYMLEFWIQSWIIPWLFSYRPSTFDVIVKVQTMQIDAVNDIQIY